jgi:hypothetical protein
MKKLGVEDLVILEIANSATGITVSNEMRLPSHCESQIPGVTFGQLRDAAPKLVDKNMLAFHTENGSTQYHVTDAGRNRAARLTYQMSK